MVVANLGAGVGHGRKAIFKEGDEVNLEQPLGDRYLAIVADGQKGSVQRNLLKLAAAATPQPSAPVNEAKEPAKNAAPAAGPGARVGAGTANAPLKPPRASAAAVPGEQPKASEAKSQSILQMIEGHESEVKRGLMIAATAFLLGWLCGGGFYARRERKSRHKLRF